ncbi:MAG: Lrp/AsnC family transcriptional regulator [Theionarchaea archaeon]|nr:Lrp/AsnC family transcriptional regulator [Theionarchaea archaeon]MBU7001544.1 Lrp/AsnC family transcriptional regulator [Theionarchaea archaeon]MBU7021403.1 Lrp/AsnC family transcriptional regulator [Theionarchaea archaeon]MBU7025157.1 Lrp/AsnC family transcriptional regulator [Theionarchaea archaeon]MBU7041017.1 Lrp/AsnC family transcriptional regulator [Theionarchaea archaeon]
MNASRHQEIDEVDRKILEELTKDSRKSSRELSELIGVSPPTISARVKRLVEQGTIARYTIEVNPENIGYEALVEFGINASSHDKIEKIAEAIIEYEEIHNLYLVTGDHDLTCRGVFRNLKELERFMREKIFPLGISRSDTSIVLKRYKPSNFRYRFTLF